MECAGESEGRSRKKVGFSDTGSNKGFLAENYPPFAAGGLLGVYGGLAEAGCAAVFAQRRPRLTVCFCRLIFIRYVRNRYETEERPKKAYEPDGQSSFRQLLRSGQDRWVRERSEGRPPDLDSAEAPRSGSSQVDDSKGARRE